MIAVIVARTPRGVIGKEGDMPWGRSLKADLRRFKELTIGQTVVMGRKTFESIGKALVDRQNIVLTTQSNWCAAGVVVASSLREAITLASPGNDIFIAGGDTVYRAALSFADTVYETLVEHEFQGDTFFPELDQSWQLEEEFPHSARAGATPYTLRFRKYSRKAPVTSGMVDPHYARGNEEYAGQLNEIQASGLCPFCPGQLHWHPNPVMARDGEWFLTRIRENYENAQDQYLIIGEQHKTELSQLTGADFESVHELAKFAQGDSKADGGALCLRFGDTKWTGATVQHLHFHVVFPEIDEDSGRAKSVYFPVG